MLENLEFDYFIDDYLDDLSESSFSNTDDETSNSLYDYSCYGSYILQPDNLGKVKRCRKKNYQHQLEQRHAANLRERRRMQSINEAFEGLRSHIPTLPYEKRLSKVDTLRLAIGYISFLADMLNSSESADDPFGASLDRTRKVIIHCHTDFDENNPFEPSTLVGHSLSWNNETSSRIGPNNKMHAKIWRPELPNSQKNGNHEKSESSYQCVSPNNNNSKGTINGSSDISQLTENRTTKCGTDKHKTQVGEEE